MLLANSLLNGPLAAKKADFCNLATPSTCPAASMPATIIPVAYTNAIRDCVEDSATQY